MADAESNLGGVSTSEIEGDPDAAAEKSEDEVLKEAIRLGAAADAVHDAGR